MLNGILHLTLKPGYSLTYNLLCREKEVIGVKPARINIDLGTDSGLLQMTHIIDCLTVERLYIPHEGITGRQTMIVIASGGSSIARDQVSPVGYAQIAFPRLPIALAVPVRRVIIRGRRRVPVIKHGIQRHLEGDVHLSPVARQHT